MKPRLLSLCVGLGAASLLAACSDPTGLRATLETVDDTLTAFALNGTPPQYPTALNTPVHEVLRADASAGFDVAFDIDEQGQAVIYPLNLVATEFVTTRRVGLQRAEGSYASVLEAPRSGYTYDSAFVARPGEVILVEAQLQPFCALDPLQTVYSKVTVDSVSTALRAVYFRMVVDPNCGFRSLAPGIPGR